MKGTMRKPPLLALLLIVLLGTTVPAQAAALPPAHQLVSLLAPEDDEETEAEESSAGDEDGEEEEDCEPNEEPCEEELEQRDKGKGPGEKEPCLLKSATVAVNVDSGKRQLRLVVHYRTSKPASVSIEALLRGGKGAVHLGASHTASGAPASTGIPTYWPRRRQNGPCRHVK